MSGELPLKMQESKSNYSGPIFWEHTNYKLDEVVNLIKRYWDIRSGLEVTTTRLGQVSGGNSLNGKEEIMCMLIDIDRGIKTLAPRQKVVIQMIILGFSTEKIARLLNLSQSTIKFHMQQAILRITNYLNHLR